MQRLLSSMVFVCCAFPVHACELLEPLAFTEVETGVYVHEGVHEDIDKTNCGNIANIGFIVGETSVAVIDPGGSPAVGHALRKAMARVTSLPISHVIISHFHPDHFFGGEQIGTDVTVIAHKNYSRALAQRGQFYLQRFDALKRENEAIQLVKPNIKVDERLSIDLGNRVLELTAHKTAHTDNDLTVFDVETRILWAGDLLFHQRIPVLDGSVTGWLEVMDELEIMAPVKVIPGHGPVGLWKDIAPKQRRYLEAVRQGVREIISKNGRLSQAIEFVGINERDDWLLFTEAHPGNVTRAFKELEWE